MSHWTDVQRWQNQQTKETISAGELLKRFDRYFRVNRMPSLCCATFDVRDENGQTWKRTS